MITIRNAAIDPNIKLTITTLKTAVNCNRIEQIRNSLQRYGLPRSGTKNTDYSILKTAIEKRKTEIAKLLINAGCRLNLMDSEPSRTPLALAIENENEELTALLLQKKAMVDSRITSDSSVLHLAAKRRSLKMLRFLLQYQLDINKICDGKTAFQEFFESSSYLDDQRNIEIVKLFLKKGASINFKINSNQTVLHRVMKIRDNNIIQTVIQATHNINEQDNDKFTALHTLLNQRNPEENIIDIVNLLIMKGANLDIQDKQGNTACHLAVKYNYQQVLLIFLQRHWNVNCINQEGNTVLHSILDMNSSHDSENQQYRQKVLEMVKLLLSKGANVDIRNANGNTACHLAAKNKYTRVLNILLQRLSDVNCCNQDGNTVLNLFLENSAKRHRSESYLQTVKHILKQDSVKLIPNNQGVSPLHIAATNRQSQVLNILLSMPVDVNATDKKGFTVLYNFMKGLTKGSICVEEDIDIVRKMMSKGADPVSYHNDQQMIYTPMHYALQSKNKELILTMLTSNFDFDKFNKAQDKSILHYLCMDKYTIQEEFTEIEDLNVAEIVEICLEKGAAVNAKDRQSKTPLYWAVLMRRKHTVKILLEYGADPNVCDNEGGTILENLMKKEIMLINHQGYGVVIGKKLIPMDIERDSEIAEMLLSKEGVAERISDDQLSLFHYCAANSHLDMLLKIIPYCKNPDLRDSSKNTILCTLLTNNVNASDEVESQVAEMVAILLSKGAQVGELNETKETPLHLAAKGKHLKPSKILLQHGACATALDINRNSTLHFMCMKQFKTNNLIEKNLTDLFLSHGCDINARNNNGMTPLLLAAESGSIGMFRILMDHGALMTSTEDRNLDMPIHVATKNNHREIVEHLIQYGVDVNSRRKDRKTPLHLSAAHKLSDITKLLLEKGADTDLKDLNGKTPLHYACWYESLDNVNELLDYGADVNAEDNFQATPLMFTQQSKDTWTKLHYHVVKLRTANMRVSARNEGYIIKCKQETNYVNNAELRQLESTVLEETLQMEKVPIAPRTSLADVLKMSADKLSVFKCNEDFQKLLNAKDFKEKFPMYADLIRACYGKGIIRGDRLLAAKDAFRKMLGLPLPDTCCDAIFHYLDNENLHNLEEAAKIRATKRKRFFDEISHNIPAKRIRRLSV